MRIVVSGVKGSGKSTVIDRVLKKGSDIKLIRVGDYFEKIFNARGLKRDEGDKNIGRAEYVEFHKKTFEQVGKEIKKHKDVIIDTNLFFTKTDGYYPGLPFFALKEVDADIIVLLEYKPEFILERRNKDIKKLGRKRSAELTVEGIEWEQMIQRHYAFVCSELMACTVKIIRRQEQESYEFEHAEKNAEEILKLFE